MLLMFVLFKVVGMLMMFVLLIRFVSRMIVVMFAADST